MTAADEDVTIGELARADKRIFATLERIESKLDNRPSWADIQRLEDNRDRRETAQDAAIDDVAASVKWIIRTAAGAAATGVITLVAYLIGAGP